MHHWEVGGPINIGWPDHGISDQQYELVEFQKLGKVFRARVTDGAKQGGFLVLFDCPDVVLEQIADQATQRTGFHVIVSNLRCRIDGTVLRSFDYEWYPTPEYEQRPSFLANTISKLFEDIQGGPSDQNATP